jgi:CheY-like chemotaxis protein
MNMNTPNNMPFLGKKLLYAGSNDLNFHLVERMLAHSGIRILRAQSEKEALSMSAKGIDVVLIDGSNTIDSFNITCQIKASLPNLPVITTSPSESASFLGNCIDAIVLKPMNKECLFMEIENQLFKQRQLAFA